MPGTVKRQQDTPESDHRQPKRQKTNRQSLDAAGSTLALEHLLHDNPSHPLYHRNAEYVINTVVDRDLLTDLIAQPFARCLDQPLFSSPNIDVKKVDLVKQTLAVALCKTVVAALGIQLASTFDVNAMHRQLEIVEEAKRYRMELRFVPVLEFVDDAGEVGPSSGAVSTRDETSGRKGKKAAKAAKKAQKQRQSGPQTSGSASATRGKRGSIRGCAVQRSTEQASVSGGYADEDQDEDDVQNSEDGNDDKSSESNGEQDDEDEYEE